MANSTSTTSEGPQTKACNFKLNKYCENKTEYFTYHSKVAAAFKQDCEKFLLAFESRQNFSYQSFAEVWRELSFGLVFVGQEFVEELSLFAESSFFTIKKYIMYGKNIYIKVGAFYLLYGIYTKQLTKEQILIRLTLDEYNAVLGLVEQMEAREVLDFVYLFKELKYGQAFQFVLTANCYGLEAKFTWQEKEMRDDTFRNIVDDTPIKTIDSLYKDKVYGLDSLKKTCEEYQNALKHYVQQTAAGHSTLIHYDSHITEDLAGLYKQMTGSMGKDGNQQAGTS